MWKGCDEQAESSTKIGSQLHIGNIWPEPPGREKSSCRTEQSQLVLNQHNLSPMPLPAFQATRQGKEGLRCTRVSCRTSMPVQVQSSACPLRDHFVLFFLCFLLPALIPAGKTHPACAPGNQRVLLLWSLFGFCKQSIPSMPQRVQHQVTQILGPGAH